VDSNYFKFITKTTKVSNSYGATVQGAYDNFEKYTCVYLPSYKTLFKQPENTQLIDLGIRAIAGTGASVEIHSSEFGFEYGTDRGILDSLYKHPVLAADIETTGLELDSKIVSIAFAWTKHDGVAIDLDINGLFYLKEFYF
jgi:hypothetical protein